MQIANPHNNAVRPVLLDCFEDDPKLQMRTSIDEEGIEEIAEAYRNNEDVPPIDAIYDAELKKYYRTNGNRRCRAARLAGKKSVECVVKNGTYRDAQLAAIRANQEHDKSGLRRTSKDKRRAVEHLLNDVDWAKWSDNRIAEFVGVSYSFVGKVRRELAEVEGSAVSCCKNEPRVGKDGKTQTPRPRKESCAVAAPDPADVSTAVFDVFTDGMLQSEAEASCRLDGDTFVFGDDPFADTADSEATAQAIGDSLFNVDEIEGQKPPKNGREIKEFAQDGEMLKMFQKLARMIDDRAECVGSGTKHIKCQKALSAVYDAFTDWCGA